MAARPAADLLTPGRVGWHGESPIGPAALAFAFAHLHTDHEPGLRAWLRRGLGGEPVLLPPPPAFGYGE